MKKHLKYLALACLCLQCKKEVSIDKVITGLTLNQQTVEADGQSTVTVSVKVSDKSSADRRTILFKCSDGIFTDSGKDTYEAGAKYLNGALLATATWKAPLSAGTTTITAEPEYNSPVADYQLSATLKTTVSEPSSITLSVPAFDIGSGFINQTTLTVKVRNAKGKFVSKGTKVSFEDLLSSGAAANGQFGQSSYATGDSASVITIYSANTYPVGTIIKIRATALDKNGNKSSATDSILLHITQ
jgi:hypothetical protein